MSSAAEKGYGKIWTKWQPQHGPTVKLLQKNLFFFSVGKSMAQLQKLNSLLVDDKGKIRNWQDFRDQVVKVNKEYNLRYLQAEYQTAKHSAQMARKWNEAQETADIFPNLEYLTQKDGHVREEHAKLHGVIVPINDPFWDTYYPPNGWRCRCYVRPTDKKPTDKKDIPKVPVHKHFRHNVGKTGQVFDQKKHPYFAAIPVKLLKIVDKDAENFLAKTTAKQVRDWAKDNLVGKKITAKDKPPFILTNKDVKTIVNKAHKNRWVRNQLLYDIKKHYKNSKFLFSTKEIKGRQKYKYWYYYEVDILGEKFYLNIVMLATGEKKLHAITDTLKK